MATKEDHDREIEGLMAEGFGDPQPVRPEVEVTVAGMAGYQFLKVFLFNLLCLRPLLTFLSSKLELHENRPSHLPVGII